MYKRILVDDDFINEMIILHEAIVAMIKLGGDYKGAKLFAHGNKLIIGIDDVVKLSAFKYEYEFKGDVFEKPCTVFHYNPEYMIAILKTLKDLKVNRTIMYLNDTDPILFYGKDVEYIYKMAFNRKLVPNN